MALHDLHNFTGTSFTHHIHFTTNDRSHQRSIHEGGLFRGVPQQTNETTCLVINLWLHDIISYTSRSYFMRFMAVYVKRLNKYEILTSGMRRKKTDIPILSLWYFIISLRMYLLSCLCLSNSRIHFSHVCLCSIQIKLIPATENLLVILNFSRWSVYTIC